MVISPKWLLAFLIIQILQFTHGSKFPESSQPDEQSVTTKPELKNISIHHLSLEYLKSFNPKDLTFFKISNSKIDRIEKNAFDEMKHLNYLEISDCKINSDLDPDTFSRLPGLEILVLRNIGLKRANLNLTNVQKLILAQNEIEDFEDGVLIGPNVNYLDISNNRISYLNSFESLSKITMIDVSKNKITLIGDHVFRNNNNLERILVSENKLTSTNGLRLPWLKTLNLFSNRITTLDSESFSNMASLEELVLAFNNIKEIDDSFKDLTELKFLNLAWNRIDEIHPSLFRNNPMLTELSLQGNKLKYLSSFDNVHYHLTQLDLSHNELEMIDNRFFLFMPKLEGLDMSFNKLKTVKDLYDLTRLKVLNLAYNELMLRGYELSKNYQLSRVNLSGNGLEMGLSHFKNNSMLTYVDLSDNIITNFCDADFALKNLMKVNLRTNQIKNLTCLLHKNFRSLCEVDLRNNPLTCGKDLDDVVMSMAMRKGSPYRLTPEFLTNPIGNQCEDLSLDRSFNLWNIVKHDLCPNGQILYPQNPSEIKTQINEKEIHYEDISTESVTDKNTEELIESEESTFNPPDLGNDIIYPSYPQSERVSWEKIEENAEFIEHFDEQDASTKKDNYNWFKITLILIVLSLSLTCFNLFVFLYIRLKVWKRTEVTPQRYTFLHNEVYKNTTEPSKVSQLGDGEWFEENKTRNKIFFYEKLNEYFLNFGLGKKGKDNESAKNILINSSNGNAQNC